MIGNWLVVTSYQTWETLGLVHDFQRYKQEMTQRYKQEKR